MPMLSLASVETCILAAYEKYLTSTTGDFPVQTGDGQVTINCRINDTNFNCGFAGYFMARGQTDNLRAWCTTHPGDGWSFGFRGTSPTHPNTLNIILINRTPLMFNFHVNLT